MKKILQLVSLVALMLWLGLTLSACGESGPPSIKKVELSRDYKDGTATGVSSTFTPNEKIIYAVATLGGNTTGAAVKMVWMQADAGGIQEEKIVEATIQLTEGQNIAFTKFTPTATLPTGKYRVDVFLNDAKVQSAEFTVS